MILTTTGNYLPSCLYRYQGNLEGWQVQMQFAAILFQIQCIPFTFNAFLPVNLQYKVNCGCHSIRVTCITDWGKPKNFMLVAAKNGWKNCHFSAWETEVHIFQSRNECRIHKAEINAELNNIDSKVFCFEQNACFWLRMAALTLLGNVYPNVCSFYRQILVLVLKSPYPQLHMLLSRG